MKNSAVPPKGFVRYEKTSFPVPEMEARSKQYLEFMDTRRTVREFSDRPVPKSVVSNLIMAASTAPSGAHKQPWVFCAVQDPAVKAQIRAAAEKEEYDNYHGRMSDEWLQDLQVFATDWHKPFLETAPWLIVVFRKIYEAEDGKKRNNYYVTESVGLACGFLLAAIHHAGLVALTHTPSPMNFLQKVLGRPENEKPFLLIPVGYAPEDTYVPDIARKPLETVSVFY